MIDMMSVIREKTAVSKWSIFNVAKGKKATSRAVIVNEFMPCYPARVLNFGCGNMNLDKALSHLSPQIRIQGLDIRTYGDLDIGKFPNLDFQIYDGYEIPYPSDWFDYSIAAAALHHSEHPEESLREIVRVTKQGGRIIILDDSFNSTLGWFMLQADHRLRSFVFKGQEHDGLIDFISENRWKRMFDKLSLKLLVNQKVRPFTYLIPKNLLVVEKQLSLTT